MFLLQLPLEPLRLPVLLQLPPAALLGGRGDTQSRALGRPPRPAPLLPRTACADAGFVTKQNSQDAEWRITCRKIWPRATKHKVTGQGERNPSPGDAGFGGFKRHLQESR